METTRTIPIVFENPGFKAPSAKRKEPKSTEKPVLVKTGIIPDGYISFPGKTFLIGEYAVLEGAPAILVNTKPRFVFSFQLKKKDEVFSGSDMEHSPSSVKENTTHIYHPRSPAGQWLKLHPEIRQFYDINSQDPYCGKGGFGFSSAQFSFVYLLSQMREGKMPSKDNVLSIWNMYRSLKFDGLTPSGADLVSQWVGDVCLFSSDPFSVCSVAWPFTELDFFLIHTGRKLDTWEHLNDLSKRSFSRLSNLAEKAMVNINNCDKEGFISTVDEYALCLEKEGLVHKKTLLFLKKIKKLKNIITAKGCGAMGAEVVALFFDSKNKETIRSFLSKEDVIAHSGDLTCGMLVHNACS
ncbi:MAG: hypothetical protein OXM55_02025 [Bdellovibrionales bacterium]|nr:hypothetical protein [Bdellovibrionales bacterium]